jgi:hypothetical protein
MNASPFCQLIWIRREAGRERFRRSGGDFTGETEVIRVLSARSRPILPLSTAVPDRADDVSAAVR